MSPQTLGGEARLRRRTQRDRGLGHAALERDERDAVSAADRVLEQRGRRAPSPSRRDGRRGASSCCRRRSRPRAAPGAHGRLPAHVLFADRRTLRPGGRPGRRRRGAVASTATSRVTGPQQPVPRVLAATERDERAVAAADRAALVAIGRARRAEDTGRIDVHARRSPGVASSISSGASSPASPGPPLFFRRLVTRATSSRTRRRMPLVDPRGRLERVDRHPVTEQRGLPPRTRRPPSTSVRPASAASAFAHWRIVTSARWLDTPEPVRRDARSHGRARAPRTTATHPLARVRDPLGQPFLLVRPSRPQSRRDRR